jgi:outer membrane protein OmpA-like peptidoglycan-associated protein
MKLSLNAASIFGLALFMLPLAAQENPPVAEVPAVEQPAAPAVDVAAPAIPEDVLKLMSDTRSLAELDDQELAKRVKKATAFAKDEALPQGTRDQLTAIADAAKGELQTRQQAAEQQKAAEEQANAEKLAAEQAAKEQAAAEKAAAAQAAQEQAAAEKAAANQAAKEQAAAEKAAAAAAAKEQAAAEKAAADQAAKEQAAAEKSAQDQAAADKAAQDQAAADKAASDKATADQAAIAQAAADQAAADQAAKDQAASNKAAADQAAKDQAAMKAAADQAAKDQTAADQVAKDKAAADQAAALPVQPTAEAPVAEVAPVAPAAPPPPAPVAEVAPPKIVLAQAPPPKEIPPPPPPPPEAKPLPPAAAVAPPPPPAPAASTADAQALDNNTGNPAAEKQAKDYLADNTDLNTLTDEQLRARLDATRELMAANELSRPTERALRTKLQAEKDVLRQRIAKVEAANQAKAAQANAANPPPVPGAPAKAAPAAPAGTTTTTTNNTTNNTTNIITILTPPQQVLRDRRPAERLDVSELQIRIQIFGDAQNNRGYDQPNRDYWRASVERDRAILRRRLIEERHRREAELALEAADDSFEISNDYQPSRRPRRDVFAAEIDDAEMEDVLIAPPSDFGREPKRRYKVDEIAVQPKLRNSISRIEIDTIRFGYNEAFIRDEQVGNLDGIAAIIEKIVKKYPNEVFLIEGHTDAPGSSVYNAKLSKLRAESIKKALTSYFVIPGKNLRTVGLGERFLKIPTADAEPENRRVSIARITSLLTQR